jgi:hypothetical protein
MGLSYTNLAVRVVSHAATVARSQPYRDAVGLLTEGRSRDLCFPSRLGSRNTSKFYVGGINLACSCHFSKVGPTSHSDWYNESQSNLSSVR